jgi:predicted glycosyltransferase
MIGAGGTMTREAALMGIPTWTVFAGRRPAVDIWLERERMLARLTRAEQLTRLTPRAASPRTPSQLRERATEIESVLVAETLDAADDSRRRRRTWRSGASAAPRRH